ncbi:MAG: SHOCT-like domain-containing protein [Thermomicrobiales bacterium]
MNEQPTRPIRRGSSVEDDRIEILKMVEAGTITANEASTLLDALDQAERSFGPAEPAHRTTSAVSHVRIRVSDAKSGRPRVNVVVPIGLVDAGLSVVRRFVPNAENNMGAVRDALLSGIRGPLVDVAQDDERVEIIAE